MPSNIRNLSNFKQFEELSKRFKVYYHDKIAGGCGWICLKCGRRCISKEFWCKEVDDFVPELILCSNFPKCGNHWRFQNGRSEKETKES